ncbi:MAG: hypothetical protein MI725_11230, partial [Pirellulales bacterium]|nr:hypothetical protein [Pirellulales bacterium]
MLRNSCNRRLRFESLEQKNLLAGDVAVSLVSGNLLIQGDAAGNNVEMQGAGAPGEFTFSGLGTTFNGSNTLTIGGVVGDVSVDLGDGLNKFVLTDASLPGSFSATLGGPTGIDDFDGYQLGPITTADPGVTIAGNLNLAFTGGTSSFQGVSLDVLGNVSITGQIELSDGVSFLDTSVAGNLDAALTAPGVPVFLLGMHSVGGDVNISGDIGDLTVRSDGWSGNVPLAVGGDFNVATGDASDVISIQQVDATGSFNLDAGNGA